MQKKPVAGLIIEKRKSDGGIKEESSAENPDSALEACMTDLIRALGSKDAKAAAQAFKAAMDCCPAQSEAEGYDELNQLAAMKDQD